MTEGGRFGPGRLDGERAEEAAALRRPGVSWRLEKGSGTRVRMRRCQGAGQVVLNGFPGSIWPWARTEQAGGERDGDKGIFVISENPGTPR